MKIFLAFALCFGIMSAYAQNEKTEVLSVTRQFFDAMEKGDSVTFRNLFLNDAVYFYVQEKDTKIRAGSSTPENFRFNNERIVRERFVENGVEVMVHNRIAVVWGLYNLWINDKFSHCGVDAFTMLKTEQGWKISSLSYTIETEGCTAK